jgi:hypothetical protein
VDIGAARGMGGVMGVTWGALEVVGIARGAAEVDEARDEEATKGQAVGLLASILRAV